jgi:SAM-dependent MidA family methyltransferase
MHRHAPARACAGQRNLATQSLGRASNEDDSCVGFFSSHRKTVLLKENTGVNPTNPSVPKATHGHLHAHICQLIAERGGWLPFDDFMQAALYAPGLGYYAGGLQKFGLMPHVGKEQGSDFVTAPELSPLFGQCLADQAAQVLQATDTHCIYEFGAGSGALALHVCEHLAQHSCRLEQYFIIEISSDLRARQQERLKHLDSKIVWLDALPEQMQGVILGNEVLDAMPVKLLQRTAGEWHERGVCLEDGEFAWQDRPTGLRPPLAIQGAHDYLTEIHPQSEAFLRTIAEHLTLGAAFFIDYGFPEAEYYHPQRHMGTLMCHYLHQADPDPLDKIGHKDITAHVNFTSAALAAQDAGLDVMGYATQGRFLLNCGLLQKAERLAQMPRAQVAKLINEHEMGELFKVLALGKGLGKGLDLELIGFAQGDRSHTL